MKSTKKEQEVVLTPEEAARWAKVSRRTIIRWFREGKLKGTQPRKRGLIRFLLSDLKKCLKARK